MERVRRQDDAHAFARRVFPGIVDDEAVAAGLDGVAPDAAGIAHLRDRAGEIEALRRQRVALRGKPHRFAAEMGIETAVRRRPGHMGPAPPDRQPRPRLGRAVGEGRLDVRAAIARHGKADDIVGAHEARHERRARTVIDLLRRALLLDPAVAEDHNPVGKHHRLLAVMGDVDGGDAEA